MWFDGWDDLVRICAVAPLAYLALVVMLRASGKRTLSKLNAFDLVVTVALGSTLATVVLSSEVSIAEGVLALLLLVALQLVVSWCSVRSGLVERLARSEPTLLYRDGFLAAAMRRERITQEEVHQVARSQGHPSLEEVAAVVLETDGTLSVLASLPVDLAARPREADRS